MGLFDRIRDTGDDEVELQPAGTESTATRTAEPGPARLEDPDGADADGDDEEFLLPGMAPAADEDDGDAPDLETDEEPGLERVIEQNERIIALLEQLTGEDAEDDTTAPADMW